MCCSMFVGQVVLLVQEVFFGVEVVLVKVIEVEKSVVVVEFLKNVVVISVGVVKMLEMNVVVL